MAENQPALRRQMRVASLEAVGRVPQNLQKGLRFVRYLHFLHDPARVIHNAVAGLLDRYVQSTKMVMVHAALLLLMLEAVTTDLVFTISLKRSTQNLQYPQAEPADYTICWGINGPWPGRGSKSENDPGSDIDHREISFASPFQFAAYPDIIGPY